MIMVVKADPVRTPIPVPESRPHVFSEEQLVGYLTSQGIRVVEYRGHLWRNAAAPSPIARRDWTPVHRWQPLRQADAGFPQRSAFAYRCLAVEPVTTTFPFVVFRDVAGYDEHRIAKNRARHVRRGLERFEYVMLDGPELLLEQGWAVAAAAAADSGMRLTRDEAEYRRQARAMFETSPPVVWAALSDGQLAGYAVTYATGTEAMFEKVYVSPRYREARVGLGLYWVVLAGWGQAPGVCNVWTGGTLPDRGVDRFKQSMGAVLENVPVHAGMRAPVEMALRRVKPNAVSLVALHA